MEVLHRHRRNLFLIGLFLLTFLSIGLSPFHPPQAMASVHSQHLMDSSGSHAEHGKKSEEHRDKGKGVASCPMTSCSPASLSQVEVPRFDVSGASTYPIDMAALAGRTPDAELRPPISSMS